MDSKLRFSVRQHVFALVFLGNIYPILQVLLVVELHISFLAKNDGKQNVLCSIMVFFALPEVLFYNILNRDIKILITIYFDDFALDLV